MAFGRFNHQLLHYKDENSRQARTIVFVNSLGTDLRIWDEVVATFGDAFRILRYDLRGHGLSDAPPAPYSMNDHVTDLAALLDACEIKSAAVVGLSVGGMIAQVLAAEHPRLVSVLVLCDTGHKIGTQEMWNARIDAIRRGGLDSIAGSLLERWFSGEFRQTRPVELAGYRNMLISTPAEGYIGTCAALRDADLTLTTSQLTQPTLCLVGEEDASTPPQLVKSLSELIPNAAFKTIPGAGHLPCVEQPGSFAFLLEAFVRRNLSA